MIYQQLSVEEAADAADVVLTSLEAVEMATTAAADVADAVVAAANISASAGDR